MNILFYCPWHDQDRWLIELRKKFKDINIVTLNDKPDFLKIKYAIIWELPDKIYKKLKNIKLLFSMGAGVDHITNLPSYNRIPIIRLKDPLMAERMSNHVVSQVLQYQLNLKIYMESQKKNQWLDFIEPVPNSNLLIGILGVGYLGTNVGNTLLNLGYKIHGYKFNKPVKKYNFKIFYQKNDLKKFVKNLDILVSILPATLKTNNMINKDILQMMKKKALLINVGRGLSINEKDLIDHLIKNKFFYVSLDVFNKEPLSKNHPFWHLSNVTITPHVASITAINSAVNHIYKKYKNLKKNKILKSDVDLNKGY